MVRSPCSPQSDTADLTAGTWEDVHVWRTRQRAALLAQRQALSLAERLQHGRAVAAAVQDYVIASGHRRVAVYWPFKGEPDLRRAGMRLLDAGIELALPVVAARHCPLEFWDWWPDMTLTRGVWDIPIPAQRMPVTPTMLIVPLLGHDHAGFRLGYGGGYYDRTLAAMRPRPETLGVGFEFARLPTIHPFPHDIAMDATVTEAGTEVFRPAGNERGGEPPLRRNGADESSARRSHTDV